MVTPEQTKHPTRMHCKQTQRPNEIWAHLDTACPRYNAKGAGRKSRERVLTDAFSAVSRADSAQMGSSFILSPSMPTIHLRGVLGLLRGDHPPTVKLE